MKIIIDAMGGDNAPQAAVVGALQASKEFGAQIILVGRGPEILDVMRANGYADLPEGVEIAHADDVVDMHDDPATVLHKRKNSSMVVGLKLLADGQGDAFVCAGSTGALLTGATLVVKRVKGIRRAAMGPLIPNQAGGRTVLLDCGANAECSPEFLLQFGLVGSVYAKKTLGLANPRVGLLNIGTEDSKGTQLQKDTYALLQDAHAKGLLNFIGNMAMFIPIGVIWPAVLRRLDRHAKVIAAGVGFSLGIELLQLPFFDRVSDVDDLILNSLGFLMGYSVYLLVKKIKKAKA